MVGEHGAGHHRFRVRWWDARSNFTATLHPGHPAPALRLRPWPRPATSRERPPRGLLQVARASSTPARQLPDDPASRRRALAALLAADPRWLHALDLFNGGFYWEAHEASKRGSPARSPNVRLSKRTGLVSWKAKPSLKTGVILGGRSGSWFHGIALLGRSTKSVMVILWIGWSVLEQWQLIEQALTIVPLVQRLLPCTWDRMNPFVGTQDHSDCNAS